MSHDPRLNQVLRDWLSQLKDADEATLRQQLQLLAAVASGVKEECGFGPNTERLWELPGMIGGSLQRARLDLPDVRLDVLDMLLDALHPHPLTRADRGRPLDARAVGGR